MVHCELLTIPLPYAIMLKNTWLNFTNMLTSRYIRRMNNVYQIGLQPLKKDKILCRKGSMDKFLSIFSFYSSFTRVLPNLRIPHSGFWLSLIHLCYSLDLRKGSTKRPCRRIPLHAPISITHTSFYASSTFSTWILHPFLWFGCAYWTPMFNLERPMQLWEVLHRQFFLLELLQQGYHPFRGVPMHFVK